VACAVACGACGRRGRAAAGPSDELIDELALLATGHPLAAADRRNQRALLDSGQLALSQYIDRLLQDLRFGSEIAPHVIIGDYLETLHSPFLPGYVLKSSDDQSGGPVLYLRQPCEPAEAVRVRPWWDLDREVQV
jgi:hypothetical protein